MGHARLGHERAPAVDTIGQPFRGEPIDLASNGHARDAVALGEHALGGKGAPGREVRHQSLEDLAQLAALGPAAEAPGQQLLGERPGVGARPGHAGPPSAPRRRRSAA